MSVLEEGFMLSVVIAAVLPSENEEQSTIEQANKVNCMNSFKLSCSLKGDYCHYTLPELVEKVTKVRKG
jgi:hypothetical protein